MKQFITNDYKETEKLGEMLSRSLCGGIVALFGDLGAGKTAFVRGMCKGLGYYGECSSPTFAIVHEYIGGRLPLYHFDMYRIETIDDLYSCGYFDYIEQEGIVAVEWSENIEGILPDDCIRVTIDRGKTDDMRVINIDGTNEIDGLDFN